MASIMTHELTHRQVLAARLVAAGADLLQIVMFPAFLAGGLSMANNVIDLAVAIVLIRLLGWHWAFVPAFVAEMLPVAELVPTWSAAVYIATRGRIVSTPEGVVVDVEPPARPAATPQLPAEPPGPPQSPRESSGE